jgi:hypothetical protein
MRERFNQFLVPYIEMKNLANGIKTDLSDSIKKHKKKHKKFLKFGINDIIVLHPNS